MKKSIVWLASYPKSGNTWTRIFLANYLVNGEKPVPINEVHRFGMGDAMTKTYNMVAGGPFNVQDQIETLRLREKVLRGIVANNADVNFVKTHNIRSTAHGAILIPDAVTRSAVYIIRNPLDMTLSFARHFGNSHKQVVESISNSKHVTVPDASSVWQYLGGWSSHVKSWTEKMPFPSLVLRYEDMLDKPHESFGALVRHIGMPVDEERLDKAIRFASFDELKQQEEKVGFVETSYKTDKFFSTGKHGQWKRDLDPELAEQIKKDHRPVMKKYGYLDD